MGHGGAPFLALGKGFFYLQHLGTLEMAEFGGPAINATADKGERAHEFRMAVALDDLGGDRGWLETELFADEGLDLRIEMGIGADGTAQHPVGNAFAGLLQPLNGAAKFVIHDAELEAEGDRLRMDAVAAANHRSEFMLLGTLCDGFAKFDQILQQDVGRFNHLHCKGGIEQVGGGQAAMNPTCRLSDMGGNLFEESDDIVIRPLFNLANFGDAEGSLFPDCHGIFLGDDAQLGHSFTGERLNLKPDFKFPLLRP